MVVQGVNARDIVHVHVTITCEATIWFISLTARSRSDSFVSTRSLFKQTEQQHLILVICSMTNSFLRYDDFRPVIKELPRSTMLPRASRFDTTLETPSGALAAFVPPQSSFTNTAGVAAYRPDTRGHARQGWMRGSVDHTGLTYVADEASRVGPAGYSVEKADAATHPKATRPIIGKSGRFDSDVTIAPGPGAYADQPPISKTIKPLAPAWSFGKQHGRSETQTSQTVLLALSQSIRQSMTGVPPSINQNDPDNSTNNGSNNQQPYVSSSLTYREGRAAQNPTRPSTAASTSSKYSSSSLSDSSRPQTAGSSGSRWSRAPRNVYNAYHGKKFTAWQDKSGRSPAPDAYSVNYFDIGHPKQMRVYTSDGKWRP